MENTVVRGDFNCLLNSLMNRFRLGALVQPKQSKQITGLCWDFGYVDVHRILHLVDKEFRFTLWIKMYPFLKNSQVLHKNRLFVFDPKPLIDLLSQFKWKHHNIRSRSRVYESYS